MSSRPLLHVLLPQGTPHLKRTISKLLKLPLLVTAPVVLQVSQPFIVTTTIFPLCNHYMDLLCNPSAKIQFWGALMKHNSVTVDITHGGPEIGKRTDGFGSNVDLCGQLYSMGR